MPLVLVLVLVLVLAVLHSACGTGSVGTRCTKPSSWCVGLEYNATRSCTAERCHSLVYEDCDGDNITDPVCRDSYGNHTIVSQTAQHSATSGFEMCFAPSGPAP